MSGSGTQANGLSENATVSGNGRFVAFYSEAGSLVPDDANGTRDVFIRDIATGAVERVSLSSAGEQGNGQSWDVVVSDNARYVAFRSYATNLVSGDTNDAIDLFVRDRVAGTTERVSVTTTGAQRRGEDVAFEPAISGDGRFVAFSSTKRFVPDDVDTNADVYVHDRTTGITEIVTVTDADGQVREWSSAADISDDGRYVVFQSGSARMVAGDTNGYADVFVRDRLAGTTRLVSLNSRGRQGNDHSGYASMTGDGHLVAFVSDASNLVRRDTNNRADVFTHNLWTGLTRLVSVSSRERQGDRHSYFGGGISVGTTVSDGGRYVVFESAATNLVRGDTNRDEDVFVRDRAMGKTYRVSVSTAGVEGRKSSSGGTISDRGRFIGFDSTAPNLVASDTNRNRDAFLSDRRPDD